MKGEELFMYGNLFIVGEYGFFERNRDFNKK
jgi:hypothetical protein